MTALALPTPLRLASAPAPATAVPPQAPVPRLGLLAANCVAQTAESLRLACRSGQLEDASAAARVALPLALPDSPHAAMLQALAEAQPTLMLPPEERRLYLLRHADGVSQGVLRLRDNHRVSQGLAAGAQHWRLHDGNLELCDGNGQTSARFMLCGGHAGLRIYLGERSADGAACMLQEVRCTYTRLSMLDPELLDPFCSLYDVDAMVPAELPQRAALLLAAPHNRADSLAEALNRASGVLFDGELLHPQRMGLAPLDRPLNQHAERTLHALRSKDAPWFSRMMLSRSHDVLGRHLAGMRVRGFVLAPAHSPAALDWALADPGLRIVHVVRSNLLAEFADILAAQQPRAQAPPLHFEPERFGRFIEMKQRQQDSLRQRLVQRCADTVEVDGSRLNAATVAELLGLLSDDSDTARIVCDAAATSAQRVIERFDNPEAVLPCLRALGRLGWAEAEGQVPDAG